MGRLNTKRELAEARKRGTRQGKPLTMPLLSKWLSQANPLIMAG